MRKQILQILALLFAVFPIIGSAIAWAQAPKDGVYMSDEEIKAVLKHSADTHRTIPDNTLRVIDMGQYQLGVAVVARGAMKGAAAAAPAAADASTAAARSVPGRQAPTASFTTIRPRATSLYQVLEL